MEVISIGSPLLYGTFISFVLVMLALDLGVFHRQAHVVSMREALSWSIVWVALAAVFGLGLWWQYGSRVGAEFATGYLIEKSLSVDNIFVFVVIFATLNIPQQYQHRVLFWGILTALILRGVMIMAGAALIAKFHWVIYVFGGFLILTGIKMFFASTAQGGSPADSALLRWVKRWLPTTDELEGDKFIVRRNGRRMATPLLLALVLVEFSDVLFAVDSIPAIFAVTRDPFIVFTANIFAILGLRSLFFLLAGVVDKFRYLKYGLAAVLVFVGIKMTIVDLYKIPALVSLAVVLALLATSMVASWWVTRREASAALPAAPPPQIP